MGGDPVGLDDETPILPEEVHLEALDARIHEWAREAGVGDQREEALLQLAAGDLRVGLGQGVQCPAKRARATPVHQTPLDLGAIELAQNLGASTGSLELVRG